MRKNNSSVVIGSIFILIGAGLLLDRFDFFMFGWSQIYPVIFLLISLVSFYNASTGQKNSAFWGGIFGVLGLFFFLRNFDIIGFFWFSEFWPIILIALGVGFLFLYIFNPQDWGALIPASILLFIGILFALDSMDLVEDAFEIVFDVFNVYWPLIFVLIGVGMILNSLRTTKQRDSDTQTEEIEE